MVLVDVALPPVAFAVSSPDGAMTALLLAGLVLTVLAMLVGYLVVVSIAMVSNGSTQLPPRVVLDNPEREIPQGEWTVLDDQQVARFLKQSPP